METTNVSERTEAEADISFRFDPDQLGTSAAVLLQWVVSAGAVERLAEAKVTHPYLFLVVTDPQGREERFVYDLRRLEALVSFHLPGTHEVRAFVVYGDNSEAKKNWVDMTRRHEYRHTVDFFTRLCVKGSASTQLTVGVSKDFFAKPLSPWEDWWLNLWYENPPWDDCAIRRRRIWAYSVQLVVVAIWVVLVAIVRSAYATWLTLLGYRGVQWQVIVHPFVCRTGQVQRDMWDPEYRNWHSRFGSFVAYTGTGVHRPLFGALLSFTPIVQVGLCAFASIDLWQNGYVDSARGYVQSAIMVAVVFQVIHSTYSVAEDLIERLSDRLETRSKPDPTLKVQRHLARSLLVPAPLTGLRLTPHLSLGSAYRRLKIRWCRPAARR